MNPQPPSWGRGRIPKSRVPDVLLNFVMGGHNSAAYSTNSVRMIATQTCNCKVLHSDAENGLRVDEAVILVLVAEKFLHVDADKALHIDSGKVLLVGTDEFAGACTSRACSKAN